MAKAVSTTPKTEPTSLNESTLESNISSEICSLFNSTFNWGYPIRLQWLFEFDRVNYKGLFEKRRCRVIRLTPIEENKRGGWDSKIVIPTSRRGKRAIFIQFKSGERKSGNTIVGSMFNFSVKSPNPHVEFSFNDNSNNNQHQTLKNLSDALINQGLSNKSVMYGFPRITEIDEFENLEEDLLLRTTFLTIPEMDSEAQRNGKNLYDGSVHFFRTCYINEADKEISTEPFKIEGHSYSDGPLYEILLVRINELRNLLWDVERRQFIDDYLFINLAIYLSINPFDSGIEKKVFSYIDGEPNRQYFRNFFEARRKNNSENNYLANEEVQRWRIKLFEKITAFFLSKNDQVADEEIPKDYTFSLPTEHEIELDFNTGGMEDISFSLLTF